MTDRFHSLTVVLEKDMRDDDAKNLIIAIRQMRGVLSVGGNVACIDSYMAEVRAKSEMLNRVISVVKETGQ